MPVENASLTSKAVLWEAAGHDRHGKVQVSAAVEIDCRWEEGRRASVDVQGTPIAVDVTMFVDQEVAAESIVWHGELVDLPSPPTGLYQVVLVNYTPDIKGIETQRDVGLKKYSDSLPEVV